MPPTIENAVSCADVHAPLLAGNGIEVASVEFLAMRGATLPPFPADMTASDVEVSVTVRFALTH